MQPQHFVILGCAVCSVQTLTVMNCIYCQLIALCQPGQHSYSCSQLKGETVTT